MFAKLPLVTLFISNLTRLTAIVCMKVRFEARVTRGFSLSPRHLRDSLSPFRGLLLVSSAKKNQEKPLGPGYFWPQLAVKGLNSLIPRASSRLFCFSCSRVLMLRASSQRSCPICFVSRVLMLTKSLVPGESSLLSQENLNCASSFRFKTVLECH